MKWLVVGVWLIFTAGVLYWIEIKTNVIYIPETIVIESEEQNEQTSYEESGYSGYTEVSKQQYSN